MSTPLLTNMVFFFILFLDTIGEDAEPCVDSEVKNFPEVEPEDMAGTTAEL